MVTQHKKGTLCGLYLEITAVVSHTSERKIWINFDANQIFLLMLIAVKNALIWGYF